jgi:flavodoxin
MRVLVAYGSKTGGTAAVAEMVGEARRRDGVPTRVQAGWCRSASS